MPIFCISSRFFQGYRMEVQHDDIVDLEHVCRQMKDNLLHDLQRLHLESLVDELNKTSLHTHNYELIDVLSDTTGRIWYICDHCVSSEEEK